jgi:hypothetical protein
MIHGLSCGGQILKCGERSAFPAAFPKVSVDNLARLFLEVHITFKARTKIGSIQSGQGIGEEVI